MRLCVLGSGSKGNCTYIEAGDTKILIDCGFSGIEATRRLTAIDVDVSTLSAVFVTHEHTDHIRGVGVLSRKYKIPVFANDGTSQAAAKELSNLHSYTTFETGVSFSFRNLKIHPFQISHDAADPVGFVVENSAFKIGYCTDTGVQLKVMHHHLSGCDSLVLETNHDPELLRNGPYPPALQQRVRSKAGHLSNAEAARFLKDIMHDSLQHVVLAHISSTNNTPELAFQEVTTILEKERTQSSSARISIAYQDRVGEIVDLTEGG